MKIPGQNDATREQPADTPGFAIVQSRMAALVHEKDWSKTPLGPIESWPQSLKTTVSLCLASNFPISIAWGPHRVQIYNDGYWPICGDKHPTSMGQDYKECWFSAWPVIGQAFEEASQGQTRFLENQRMFLDRYGYLEETFFTFSFSPILDESGGVGGLFHPVTELTQQTLAERRLHILSTISDGTAEAKTTQEASALILETLRKFEFDLPFVLLYSLEGRAAKLQGATGVLPGSLLAPQQVSLDEPSAHSWPFSEILEKGSIGDVKDLEARFGTFTCCPYPEPPKTALVIPIPLAGLVQKTYFLVAGVSARRELDEKYRLFYDLLAAAITNALNKAKAYEEERQRAETLAELDRAKTTFFSNISHEFRTPLTLMLGPLEDALTDSEKPLAREQQERLLLVQRNTLRLQRLVNSLLDFSRIEAGRLDALFEPTDLSVYTAELASVFSSAMEKAGLKYQIDCPPLKEPAYVDHDMWEKIVFNLLSNALKFTFEGSVSVLLKEEQGAIVLQVKDSGEGIPQAQQGNLFKRFYRVEGGRSRSHEGSGIGLAFVQELVKLHGGTITVESEPGKGSTFAVSIPTGKDHLPPDRLATGKKGSKRHSVSDVFLNETLQWFPEKWSAATGETQNGDGDGRTDLALILVVDDNADMRDYIVRILEAHKHWQIRTAKDGLEALDVIRNEKPQLVVSDVMMPHMDGFALLQQLRSQDDTKAIPVIFLSARAGEEATIEGLEKGADDYLVKPFSARELVARVRTQLEITRTRQDNTELWKTQEELKKFKILSDLAFDAFILMREDGSFGYLNDLALKRWGYTREEAEGLRVPDVDPNYQGDKFREVFALAQKQLLPPFETIHQRKDGSRFPVEVSMGGITLNGQPHIFAVARDITERKKIEQELKDAKAQLELTLQHTPASIYLFGKNGELLLTNLNGAHLMGFSSVEELLAEKDLALVRKRVTDNFDIYNEERQPYKVDDSPAAKVFRTGQPAEDVILFVRKSDGKELWILNKSAPLLDEKGELQLVITNSTDITLQKTAEERIRQSEERFRQLAESMPQIVWTAGPDGTPDYFNRRWYEYTGFAEGANEDWHTVLHPQDMKPALASWETSVKSGSPFQAEYRFRDKQGGYRWFLGKALPIQGRDGSINKWFGTSTDITDQKTIAEQLEKLVAIRTAELQRSNDDLLQFAHVASHDLKEPLRKIKTFAGRLMDDSETRLSAKGQTYLGKMNSAADRMYSMIEGVLAYSTVNSEEQSIAEVSLGKILQQIETDLEVLIQQKEATIDHKELPVVEGSEVLLYQLFYNLVNNALKFSSPVRKPVITITGALVQTDAEAFAEIRVADNGIGFDPLQSERIFESFSRLNSKDRFEGTGLGLSLCKKIVQRHGGFITADGKVDQGAVFTVLLPVKQSKHTI
jgi:PAS domain S-box-containing protein